MTIARPRGTLALVASAILVLTSCDSKSTAPPAKTLSSISVAPATASLAIGATQALTVTATYSDATTAVLTSGLSYSSSAPAIATIASTGTVTAVAAGAATITVTETASSKTATSSITVLAPTLSSIAITPATASLQVGGTQALVVTGTYSDNSTAVLTTGVTFASTQASVATVTTAGLVTAVAAGSATITATASSRTATAAITVTAAAPTISSIAIVPSAISLAPTATRQLAVTATYSDATTADVTAGTTFLSSATAVATVSGAGLVTGVAAGSATITATNTLSGKVATAAVTVAPVGVGAMVFSDAYDAGVTFVGFGGADNAVSIDPTTLHNGRKALKAVITGTGGFSGGAFVSAVPRDLSAYNAVTFWAKANVARSSILVGIGNNGTSKRLNAESIGIPLTTSFQKFIVPMPNPAKMVGFDGLFHFADGPNNYTVWFADIQFENLPSAQVGLPTGTTANWPATTVGIGSGSQLVPAPNTVSFTTPALPNGGRLTDVAWRWYTLTSSNTSVATVSPDGLVTGVSAGTAMITATLGALTVAGSSPVTVTAPLALPTTIAATPTVAAADVISLFSSAYTNRAVDTWRTSWSAGNNELVDPYVIAGHDVKRYSLFNFVGVEFGVATPANTVDATGYTTFHVDLWTPNPSANLEIQLVNNATGTAAIGKYQAGALATGSWISLDIPLSSFAGLTSRNMLQQLLFVSAAPTVLYVDNIYFRK